MDKIKKTFDKWAQNGKAELMEKEHSNNFSKRYLLINHLHFLMLDVEMGG